MAEEKNKGSIKGKNTGSLHHNKYFDIHPPVFWTGAILTIIFIIGTLTLDNTHEINTNKPETYSLNAQFEEVSGDLKDKLGVEQGVEVIQIQEGFLKEIGVEEDLIITSINGNPVMKPGDVQKHIEASDFRLSLTVVEQGFGFNIEKIFTDLQNAISERAGWFFILSVNLFLLFMLYLGFSKLGGIRLGAPDEKPEFSTLAWFSMLFSAGMGIGILFWSVAEPMYHYLTPPMGGEGGTAEAAKTAMDFAFLHWGLHAWGIYALVGMALAFFAFRRKLPLSIRSVFYPVFGKRIYGTLGDVIDILAVLSTLFGLATSLGLGVKQINAGMNFLFGLQDSVTTQVLLIAGITMAATISVVLGIDKGVKVLSELNVRIGAVFLIFMLIIGPTLFIMDSFVQNFGSYFQELLHLGFWTESYSQTDWQNSWTVFYWSWWIAWSPFVGMFIARVSRGRTVREFVFGVLLVPSIITFLWLSAFGGSALYIEMNGLGNIAEAVQENVAIALFSLLSNFPLASISSFLGVILVMSFFVTSSDSGSLVVDSITSGGKVDAPVGQRIFWALSEGAVAAVLLIGGGLNALQTAVITAGLPFTFVLLLMCYSLFKGLHEDHAQVVAKEEREERESYEKMLENLVEKHQEKAEK